MDTLSFLNYLLSGATVAAVGYVVFHYVLFFLATNLRSGNSIGLQLNEFEERQLLDWTPKKSDFLKHDDEDRSYDDVFGGPVGSRESYNSCTFPRTPFSNPYEADLVLLGLEDGMSVLDLGCGSGAAAEFFASRRKVQLVCVTNAERQAAICRKRLDAINAKAEVIVADFDALDLPENSFDAVCSFESIGYTKNLDLWLANCHRSLKPGGRLLIRTPASLENCRRSRDYENVSVFFDNWRYNFFGANVLAHKMRRIGFQSIRYRQIPFWAWGLTWNFICQVLRWKRRLRMRSIVGMERIIWQSSKVFILGNAYNIVLAEKSIDRTEGRVSRDAASPLPESMVAPSD